MVEEEQIVRIVVNFVQQTDKGVPFSVTMRYEDGTPVNLFRKKEQDTPSEHPVPVSEEGLKLYTDKGGKAHAKYLWTGPDGKERTYEKDSEIPTPPVCPRCERAVVELEDYLCSKCRFG